MEPGQVVEYIDSQRILCAVVLEAKNLRLRLLNENNRELKLSAPRLIHRSSHPLDTTWGRDKLVAGLKEIVGRRKALCREIDIQALWEVLHPEQEWIDLVTMTALCFPDQNDNDHESAVIRALFNDRLYFKFSADRFFPHSAAKVEQIVAQRHREERDMHLVEQGGAWLKSVLKGPSAITPESHEIADEIVRILTSCCLFEKESPQRDLCRAMLKHAGVGTAAGISDFLVKIGEWGPHENLDLLLAGITEAFPAEVEARAAALGRQRFEADRRRRDLRDLDLVTIDGPSTQDFDDALSVSREGGNYRLGIHIADVGHYIAKDDAIDREAMLRGSSIYMPDQKISMLPASLSVGICSLKAQEERPAISTMVTITPEGRTLDFEIFPSLIRVHRQLTYQDADLLADTDEQIRTLHDIACSYRNRRLDEGAMVIELPEISIRLDAGGTPLVTRIDRENPSHLLVSELMILANSLAARFLHEKDVPAIYRSQAEPRERLFERDEGTLYQYWMQRKQISRFVLGDRPEPHAGLGVAAYTTCTSPIRKYYDLVTQRQIRAALGLETAYEARQIDAIIAGLAETMRTVSQIQYRRHRYWLLKYLEGRIGTKEEAIILNRRRNGFAILMPRYLIECHLSGAENINLKPEDLVQVTLQHVNARNDIITVYLG